MNDSKFWSKNQQKFVCVSKIDPEDPPKSRQKYKVTRMGSFETEQEAKDFVASNAPEIGYELVILKKDPGKSEQDALAEWMATQHKV